LKDIVRTDEVKTALNMIEQELIDERNVSKWVAGSSVDSDSGSAVLPLVPPSLLLKIQEINRFKNEQKYFSSHRSKA